MKKLGFAKQGTELLQGILDPGGAFMGTFNTATRISVNTCFTPYRGHLTPVASRYIVGSGLFVRHKYHSMRLESRVYEALFLQTWRFFLMPNKVS